VELWHWALQQVLMNKDVSMPTHTHTHTHTHTSSLPSSNTLGPVTASWVQFRSAGGWTWASSLLPQSYEMKAYLDFDHQTAVSLLTSVHAPLFRRLLYRREYSFILSSEYRGP